MLEQSTHATPFAHHLRTWVHGLGNSRVSACLAVLGSMYMYMFGATPARAAVHLPVITAVTANYSINQPTITIAGGYFGTSAPGVTLNAAPLVVATYTSTSVTALLPANLSPGSYRVALTNSVTQLQGIFDATIGAVGPEGPAGPAGATGSAGPAGSNGPSGPQRSTGTTGATGPQGPSGPAGPQGVAGPTGATGPQGLTWQGVWNNSATYALNDAVSFNGSTYISLVANNTANEPDNAPAAWSLVAIAGTTGSQGPAGATGATGPQGPSRGGGPQGATGATGLMGPAGPVGPLGQQGLAGPTGATGPQGLTWQGVWNNSATYALNDAVSFNGSTYI